MIIFRASSEIDPTIQELLRKCKDCGIKVIVKKEQEINELIYKSPLNGRVGKARGKSGIMEGLGSIYAEHCLDLMSAPDWVGFQFDSGD